MSSIGSEEQMRSETGFRLIQTLPAKGNWIVSHQGLRMGEMGRKSMRVQQLSEFALTDSLREKVSNSLRKRRKSSAVEVENGTGNEELRREGTSGNSSSPALVVKLRSTRVKRPAKFRAGPQVVEPGIDCDENGAQEESSTASSAGNSSFGAVVVKVRSARAKRSDKVGTGSQVAKPGRLAELSSTVVKSEVVRKPGLGDNQDYKILDASFYECDALELAPKLLGKLIKRDDVILQITEVEAYRPGDSACHARVGETARTAPLFGPAGHAYVYLCYGLHVMLNVVADSVGVGAAVLIRACSPVAGLSTIQLRRNQATAKPVLLTGPGKVGQALGLTTEWTSHSLYTPGGLEILDAPPPTNLLVGPRVGIDYAEPKDVAALWRFAIADNSWVSAPRATLRPAIIAVSDGTMARCL